MNVKLNRVIITSFIFVVFSINCFSQSSYIKYHQDIIKAEKLFLSNNFVGSIDAYKRCFSTYKKSFVKDLFIASEIAAIQNDSASLYFFLNESFRKGLPWRVIETDSLLSSFLFNKAENYKRILTESFIMGRTYYLNHINLPLRYEILLMNNKDQLFHEFPHDVKINIDNDSIYAEILDDNLEKIIKIINKHGYPGEHLIGINNKEDDNVSHYTRYEDELNEITPMFFYHNACCFQRVSRELYNAIFSGDIHPREYALIYEWSFNHFRYIKDTIGTEIEMDGQVIKIMPSQIPIKPCNLMVETERYGIDKSIQAFNNTPISDEKINTDRAKIGIASLEHDKLKKEFEKKYRVKLFFGMFEEL